MPFHDSVDQEKYKTDPIISAHLTFVTKSGKLIDVRPVRLRPGAYLNHPTITPEQELTLSHRVMERFRDALCFMGLTK